MSRKPTDEEIAETRANLPPGYRLCAPKISKRSKKMRYCYHIKPDTAMRIKRDSRGEYVTNQCVECARATGSVYYRAKPATYKKKARDWAKRHAYEHHPERVASRNRRRRGKALTEEERKKRRAWNRAYYERHSVRIRAAKAARDDLQWHVDRAPIPVEVAAVFMRDALPIAREATFQEWAQTLDEQQGQYQHLARGLGDPRTVKGYTKLAGWMGINEATVRAAIQGRLAERGQKAIKQAALDGLSVHCDWSIHEVVERTREWALLTGDSWPYGYRIKEKKAPRSKPKGESARVKTAPVLQQIEKRQAA